MCQALIDKVLPSLFSRVCSRIFTQAYVAGPHCQIISGNTMLSPIQVQQSWSRTTDMHRDGPVRNIQVCQMGVLHSPRISNTFLWMGASTELSFLGRLSKVPVFLFTC